MRLKQIKLAGFKSFVDLTTVPFPEAMTAVVGPNGCGKSNVIDAVRWVLGESSAKNLRGDAMTDVIFNGSAQRKPVSQASVELVFENTQGRLAGQLADRSEIAIKRLVTRDAQSSYFLNGSKCRRRDITDIFLGTGLGPRSYAIIEQGMISRLIESKPQELRVFIEEAAGISKYKERRRETENRIKHTRDNLDRLADVREELGKNIEKLKRQAATAQRYKELKAQERKLKAEVTTIKWLGFNQQLTQLEQQLREQETELEKYFAAQSGDQRILLELKEQAANARSEQEQRQQHFYQLGATISRLEQQILGQRQQQQMLQSQLQQKQQSLQEFNRHQQTDLQQLAELVAQLEELEPDTELQAEQAAELEWRLQDATQQVRQQQQHFESWQQNSFSLREQAQQLRLQLQHLQQQQQQLAEQQLRQEQQLALLDDASLAEALAVLQHEHETLLCAQQQAQQTWQQQQVALSRAEQELTVARQELQQWQNQQQVLQLEQQRLEQLQQALPASEQQLLQQLELSPGWALAVAFALGNLQHANIVEQHPDHLDESGIASYLTTDWQSANSQADKSLAVQGTLASAIKRGPYPESFRHILLADTLGEALAKQSTLSAGQSVICPQGVWLGINWGMQPDANATDSALLRQERLQQLTEKLQQLTEQLALASAAAEQAKQRYQQLERLVQMAAQQQEDYKSQLQQVNTTIQLKQLTLQQVQQQRQQLQQSIAELSAQRQILTARYDEQQVLQDEAEHTYQAQQTEQQQYQQKLQLARQQEELLRSQSAEQRQRLVQLQMQSQLCQRQQQSLEQNLARAAAQQGLLQQQITELQQQLAADDDPALLLQEQLQESLLLREDAESALKQANNVLGTLEQQIRELEQGQSGIVQRVSQQQKALESLRLDAEGYRIRANNMLELLREQQVSMKEVLAELPAAADEQTWQQQLDKTVDAVSRLGAINLAAIEEYEQQAERKQYLDDQHQDLVSALETLETAMRKIDRETKQRFKDTFEEVNEGLKQLFPKVFGGGSAYLDLTDEDLLETGVSIMARPPGKKNSTIHLLSGGEKALTALSLVFSIFRLNPAPFCMLDEVDAPLDDANVGRFCNLVREMSETVQFIYISHNKIAMEMAAQLMGVTMQEPGVSRVVAVDVDDAVKLAVA
ncbi:chromosome partition protein Smc [Alishewanella longhuensis]|uniref:Chromosome partition protein Smc n=1 Tax=Alishewanella longhuensis TaxID=1091037 RepID=A0ABQ3KVT3_9ALTE|nr:chromosome segregation protein SMC [Alishewanella longhuensis]GHG63603.1 chromosome partition protein Smc [Alishewanella longhuensis]